jgi:hypothetical protein
MNPKEFIRPIDFYGRLASYFSCVHTGWEMRGIQSNGLFANRPTNQRKNPAQITSIYVQTSTWALHLALPVVSWPLFRLASTIYFHCRHILPRTSIVALSERISLPSKIYASGIVPTKFATKGRNNYGNISFRTNDRSANYIHTDTSLNNVMTRLVNYWVVI